MSKKGGTPKIGTPSNTLFNYFAKSPATPKTNSTSILGKTPQIDDVIEGNKTCNTPTSTTERVSRKTLNFGKRSKNEEESPILKVEDVSDEDVIINNKPKRRRIIVESDDSDIENDKDVTNIGKGKEDFDYHPINEDDDSDEDKQPKKKIRVQAKANSEISESNVRVKKKLALLQNIDSEDITKESTSVITESEPAVDEPVVWLHNKLEFLKQNKIKDINNYRPCHPNYDGRTLYVPAEYLNTLTPAMRQWWIIKSSNYDCVLFFKVGKFYELYHMDATVGVNELGFSYMRGEFAHSGFPETAYDRMATNLVERGYKVARIEQTETPDMMQERCKKQGTTSKYDKVVRREVCQVTNKGTQVFGQQVEMTFKHQANFMLSITETFINNCRTYGICYIDTSIGQFYLGQFEDDAHCSRLLILLTHVKPTLVLHDRPLKAPHTEKIFKTILSSCLKEPLTDNTQFWHADKTLKFLAENHYLKKSKDWPSVLRDMQSANDHWGLTPDANHTLSLKALGGCLWYLQKCYLDQQILALARYNHYTPPDLDKTDNVVKNHNHNKYMILDSATLSNLNVIGETGSLLRTLDHCCTRFGKRLLNHWVCMPSCELEVIKERQLAVTEFMENDELLKEVRQVLGTLPDLERQLAQIHSFGNLERLKNHPDGRAVLYEEKTYGRKKIRDFISTLDGFESLMILPNLFKNVESKLLRNLTQQTPEGSFPNMKPSIIFFKNSFNRENALKEGVIAPAKGVDDEYDAIEKKIEEINEELNEYLKEQEKYFGCRINYFGTDKKRFQLEIPESYQKKAGTGYHLEGQKKGNKPVKRYSTDETKDFLKRMINAEDQRKAVLKDLSRRIFEKFSSHYEQWEGCVKLVAILDILSSLAHYAKEQPSTCIPEIVQSEQPIFLIDDGRHPCMSDSFIPNGITLGEGAAALSLLTGPNMGGKSTLMRQMGLLAIMVQIGSRIPAESCKISLIDRIFTRLGASDDIMSGHSTFLVELRETVSILKHATTSSLVLLDELGRGTSTYDGAAIAGAVVDHLADLGCRSIFSTHYHNLVDNFHDDNRIALGHMACMVENENTDDPTEETVTFLYKYADGPCPKSYGFNAAKLAGLQHAIIKRAHTFSKKVAASALKLMVFVKMLEEDIVFDEIKDLLQNLNLCFS